MSMKGKARIAAAQALGSLGKVQKLRGQLHVLRMTTGGRARDWQRIVKKIINQILPNWKVIETGGETVVFGMVKP